MSEKRRAPALVRPVGSTSWDLSKPKPIQLPIDWPPYYPIGLIPESAVILDEAVRKFPTQTEILPLCQWVVRKLTPHFLRAVQADGLRADLARDVIHDLVRYLLIPNCNCDSSEMTRLEQEVRRSKEWAALARKVATVAALTSLVPNPALSYQPVATENLVSGQVRKGRGRPPNKILAPRRKIIQRIAAPGVKGEAYCKALHAAGLMTPLAWQKNENCPKEYPTAWNHGDPKLCQKWRQRIRNEKYNNSSRRKS